MTDQFHNYVIKSDLVCNRVAAFFDCQLVKFFFSIS